MASLLRLWSFGMRFYCFIALWLLQLPLFLCLTVSLPQPVVMLCSNVSRVANTIHHAAGVVRVVGRLRVSQSKLPALLRYFHVFVRFTTFPTLSNCFHCCYFHEQRAALRRTYVYCFALFYHCHLLNSAAAAAGVVYTHGLCYYMLLQYPA